MTLVLMSCSKAEKPEEKKVEVNQNIEVFVNNGIFTLILDRDSVHLGSIKSHGYGTPSLHENCYALAEVPSWTFHRSGNMITMTRSQGPEYESISEWTLLNNYNANGR